MPNHQASEQMLGYLYQVRYALALLLENDNSDCQISIEKFDDVAFSKDDIPIQLIQLKHHIQHQGNLADASTDMWRTIKVWLDAISETPDILDGTNFLIITTARGSPYCLFCIAALFYRCKASGPKIHVPRSALSGLLSI